MRPSNKLERRPLPYLSVRKGNFRYFIPLILLTPSFSSKLFPFTLPNFLVGLLSNHGRIREILFYSGSVQRAYIRLFVQELILAPRHDRNYRKSKIIQLYDLMIQEINLKEVVEVPEGLESETKVRSATIRRGSSVHHQNIKKFT